MKLAGHSHISETCAVNTADDSLSGPVLEFVQDLSAKNEWSSSHEPKPFNPRRGSRCAADGRVSTMAAAQTPPPNPVPVERRPGITGERLKELAHSHEPTVPRAGACRTSRRSARNRRSISPAPGSSI